MSRVTMMLLAVLGLVGCATSPAARTTVAFDPYATRVIEGDLFPQAAPEPIAESEAVAIAEVPAEADVAAGAFEAVSVEETTQGELAAVEPSGEDEASLESAELEITSNEPDSIAGEPVVLPAVESEPAYHFDVRVGEYVRHALERWCGDHDVTLVWQARYDLPVVAAASFPADNLREAVTSLLTAAWHPKAPLIADEYPNRVLVVRHPEGFDR